MGAAPGRDVVDPLCFNPASVNAELAGLLVADESGVVHNLAVER